MAQHPLEHRWTLWFDNPITRPTRNNYVQSVKSVYSFDTVEDFWCMFHNIRTPGQLQPTATFSLFKAEVQPKWEAIPNGGAWAAMVPKGPNSKSLLDEWWKHAVLAAIGEQFDDYGEVCGIVVNIRPKGDRVELWTRTAANEAAQMAIGRQLKQFLNIQEPNTIGYSVFSDKLVAGNKAKDLYTV